MRKKDFHIDNVMLRCLRFFLVPKTCSYYLSLTQQFLATQVQFRTLIEYRSFFAEHGILDTVTYKMSVTI